MEDLKKEKEINETIGEKFKVVYNEDLETEEIKKEKCLYAIDNDTLDFSRPIIITEGLGKIESVELEINSQIHIDEDYEIKKEFNQESEITKLTWGEKKS